MVAVPWPDRWKASTNSIRAVAVVWSIKVTMSVRWIWTDVASGGIDANSRLRCKVLKQTIGRPKYMW